MTRRSIIRVFAGGAVAIVMLALAAFAIYSYFSQTFRVAEANFQRTFEAGIVSIQDTQRNKVDCPRLNEFQPEMTVLRIQLDRPVTIWAENGTGKGEEHSTDQLDFRLDVQVGDDQTRQQLISQVGRGPQVFRYSRGFLSVCDENRIPVVSRLEP